MILTVERLEKLRAMSAFTDHLLKQHAYRDRETEFVRNGGDERAARAVAMEMWGRTRTMFTVAYNKILAQAEAETVEKYGPAQKAD